MSIDIVNLIESNPITQMTADYQSKLIETVKQRFSSYEQQMFVASFYCYLNCHDNYVINLDDIWKWLGFSTKQNAKTLLERQFVVDKDYLLIKQTATVQGGHNKETFMLNVNTFKKFCLKAGTKKADEIHDYYIKLEKVLQEILQQESNELKHQLEQAKEEIQQADTKLKRQKVEHVQEMVIQKVLERESILLKEFATIGSIVYVIRVKTLENGQYVIKIGESRKGIAARYAEHKANYDECLLLDCFLVQRSKDFESFIQHHDEIRLNRVSNLPGHEAELELFLIGRNLSYQALLKLINHNLPYFNNRDTRQLELEVEKLKLLLENKETNNVNPLLEELIKKMDLVVTRLDKFDGGHKQMCEKINSSQSKVTTGFNMPLVTLGPRLQKIHPETLQLLKVYESVNELMKENSEMKRPSINKAVQENTIYNGFRWLLVDRELDPTVIHQIHPTKIVRAQNLGYIAKLNSTKTEILNVYLDRKTAAVENHFQSSASLDPPVKNKTIANGHFYFLYDDCEEDLRAAFVAKNKESEPLLYKNGVGQFDSENKMTREFACKYDCIRGMPMSDKTLEKALTTAAPYNGYVYKYLNSKLKCF
jgi:phage anti-repressor protein